MTDFTDDTGFKDDAVVRLFDEVAASDPVVVEPAVSEISQLVSLWPLEDAARIDNDVKYGEELQVRITREVAARLTKEDVTIADSEYVYEGGVEEIPGRPRVIATALLAANDAYDESGDYSEDRDVAHLLAAGTTLDLGWSSAARDAMQRVITTTTAAAEAATTGEKGLSAHLTVSAAAAAEILALGESAGEFAAAALLYVNELNEIQELPRVFASVEEMNDLYAAALAVKEGLGGPQATSAAKDFLATYSALAAKECAKHREDVLWDPAQAKKDAKEADEAKNKAALAAKFAHVDNDAGKEHVEL
ncbi:MAG: hypothetical protein LKI93_00750 [Bifidobacteriaceae bacterium]|jgi:hypothetical protein|nr:hypothetical protein [Bifidobacteriaceae bacterium]MCI1915046.1 hypothetical protein [Bifidobacteriaceae bacterium]